MGNNKQKAQDRPTPIILHVLNNLAPSSGPYDRASEIGKHTPVLIAVFSKVKPGHNDMIDASRENLIFLNGKNKLDLRAWGKLLGLAKENKIDIVNSHHHHTGIVLRLLKFFGLLKTKVVHSFGNHFSDFSKGAKLLHLLTLPTVDAVVFVSKSSLESMSVFQKRFLPKKRRIILNGLVVEEVAREKSCDQRLIKDCFGLSDYKGLIIGNVSRIIPQKDHTTLLNGFAKAVQKGFEAKLLLVGEGSHLNAMKVLAKDLHVSDRVVFTGFVDRTTVYKILHSIDLFVMTSLWEGLSVALLQAMAAAKPIVATKIPSIEEVIDDGVSGKLIPVKNPDKLANALIFFSKEPSVALKWGQAAKQVVEERFSISKTGLEYMDLYKELMGKGISY